MQLTKFKITTASCPGYMVVIYQDNNFKSVLNEFKPALSEKQLNAILNYIPNDPTAIEGIFIAKYGDRVKVEPVKAIGAEPETDPTPDYPVNEKIALWCRHYSANHKDGLDQPVKYKTGQAEAGKIKALPVTPGELDYLLGVYFAADEWYLKPKSISNFVKKYNEVRAIAYAQGGPKKKKFPLPYDANVFNNLGTNDQREYWDYLRENGYVFEPPNGRGSGKWVKKQTI